MMILGFTGTREGLTPAQYTEVTAWLVENTPRVVHHGDCVGADDMFHALCLVLQVSEIVVHPPVVATYRAFRQRRPASPDRILSSRSYLGRNCAIVDDSTFLLACPGQVREKQRSGTWATIRYARRVGRNGMMILPDGSKTDLRGASLENGW